jgi:hypothetical protein
MAAMYTLSNIPVNGTQTYIVPKLKKMLTSWFKELSKTFEEATG